MRTFCVGEVYQRWQCKAENLWEKKNQKNSTGKAGLISTLRKILSFKLKLKYYGKKVAATVHMMNSSLYYTNTTSCVNNNVKCAYLPNIWESLGAHIMLRDGENEREKCWWWYIIFIRAMSSHGWVVYFMLWWLCILWCGGCVYHNMKV